MTKRIPKSSHPELVAVLDSVAALLNTLSNEAPVTLGAHVSPATSFWETLDWLEPTRWTSWVKTLAQEGVWPLDNDEDAKELALAMSCYAGLNAHEHYAELKANPRGMLLNVTGDPGSSTVESCAKALRGMIALLNQDDRDYLTTSSSLGLPWYEHWAARSHTVAKDVKVAVPNDLSVDFDTTPQL